MVDLNNIVNISILESSASLAGANMNACLLLSSEKTDFLNSANRFLSFANASEVEKTFGSNSKVTAHANVFFSQQPNPVSASGNLNIGFWRKEDETVPATNAVLTGGQIDEPSLIASLQQIVDGSFKITIDGTENEYTAINGSIISSISDLINILNAKLSAEATVTYVNNKIIITSYTTGTTSNISFAENMIIGTDISELLKISAGSGATIKQGEVEKTLTSESVTDALTELKQQIGFKGVVILDNVISSEDLSVVAWFQANDVLCYDVFSEISNLEKNDTNPCWAIKIAGMTRYRMLFDKNADRKIATTYMARNHTVNFNASNSTLTMNLKELKGVLPCEYTQTEISKADDVGLDIYTIISGDGTTNGEPVILCGSGNDFVDNIYNLIAFKNQVQVSLVNVLKTTTTKIPQTIQGVNTLLDTVEKITRKFIRAGFINAGTWNSPDFFGDQETFLRNISQNGFYWLAGELSEQLQADREARKSPILQGAIKFAGAIHSVDLIININY